MQYSELKAKLKRSPYTPRRKSEEIYKRIDGKKPFLKWAVLSVLLLVIFLVASPWVFVALRPQVDHKIESLIHRTKGRKIELDSVDLGIIQLTHGGLIFNQVRAHGTIHYEYPYFQPRQFDIYIPILQINFQYGLSSGFRVNIQATGLEAQGREVVPGVEETSRRLESVSDVNFKTAIHIGASPWKWKRQAIKWARQFKAWALDGSQMKDINLSGNANFVADGVLTKVYFSSRKERKGAAYLVGDADDLRRVAQIIEPKFTEDDIAIASKNLLKTPKLLDIRTHAEKMAEKIYKPDSNFEYDVPRHIFWSYWLTQIFGPKFALSVTDAHEAGDLENTTTEHEKDRHDNALGIEYAQRKLSAKEVEKMILTDSRIPRNKTI